MTNRISLNGRTSIVAYATATRHVRAETPLGRKIDYHYDAMGMVTNIQLPGMHPYRIGRDANGRVSELVQGSGVDERRVTLNYDTNGHLRRITNALGQDVQVVMDRIGRVTNIVTPNNGQIAITYNKGASITGITPPGRPKHGFSHDEISYPVAYSAPNVGVPTNIIYSWNTLRDLTGITFPDGRAISNIYSTVGERVEQRWPENKVTYDYHPTSRRLVGVTASNGPSVSLGWDGPLVTSMLAGGPITGAVQLAYNHDFRLSSLGFNGDYVAYGYDLDGLMTNAGSLLIARDIQSGSVTNLQLGQTTVALNHNLFGELSSLRSRYLSTNLLEIDYHYDKLGRITGRVEGVQGVTQTWNYVYDLDGRLYEVYTNGMLRSRYQYDANGNRTNALVAGVTVSARYDDQDRLLTNGTTRYYYTAHGTLTNTVSGSVSNVYVYDTRGSLLQVSAGTNIVHYTVDPWGRRIARKRNGITTQRLVYQDFLKPAATIHADGSTDTRFVYSSRDNVPDYMVRSGLTYRILTDHLGSVRLVVRTDNSQVVQRLDYDEWGRVLLDTNPGFQPFGFVGGLYDHDTGLVRFGFRDYDPTLGRWLAKDPILFAGGQANLYLYCHGDPINYIDPYGLGEQSSHQRIWIEGRNPDEPRFHRSISVGDPNGSYRSFSFGIDSRWKILIPTPWRMGEVYEDFDPGGKVVKSMPVTDEEAKQAIEILELMDGEQWSYGITYGNCRQFSGEMFEFFEELFDDEDN